MGCKYFYDPIEYQDEGRYCGNETRSGSDYCNMHSGDCRVCGKEVQKHAHENDEDVICWSCWRKEKDEE